MRKQVEQAFLANGREGGRGWSMVVGGFAWSRLYIIVQLADC